MVTLFNSDDQILRPFELICASYNSTHNISEPARVVRIVPGIQLCKWTQHIAICDVAKDLTAFAIKDKSSGFHLEAVQVSKFVCC